MTAMNPSGTLLGAAFPRASGNLLRGAIIIVLGSLLLTLSAKIQIPFYPVPLTLQTLVVLLIGATCGWRLGALTVIAYMAQGAAGLPVFAGTPEKGIGLAYMVGPTGGYLLGFVLAAAATGFLAERGFDRNPFTAFAAMIAGNALIYLPGLLWLGALLGWDKPILEWGFYPFLLGDLTKAALGAALLPLAWKFVGRRNKHG